jgi:N-acetylmuramoyl-L-alanine amidase
VVCAAAFACLAAPSPVSAEEQVTSSFPVASDARLAGDAKQTRFVLDLDRTIQFRAFALSDPYRVVVDMPQVNFRLPEGAGTNGRGLVRGFRYGLVMPGGSRIVIDLAGPAKVKNSYVLDSANGQPPRLVVDVEETDRASIVQSQGTPPSQGPAPTATQGATPPQGNSAGAAQALAEAAAQAVSSQAISSQAISSQAISPGSSPPTPQVAPPAAESRPALKPAISDSQAAISPPQTAPAPAQPVAPADPRPVVVIDPGHGGVDNGTQSGTEVEKSVVLAFGLALRDRLEKSGKYRVVMTRTDDTFIPLADRVQVARLQGAALFVSIHADALPKGEGDAQGATIYTLSDHATDAQAASLAESENRADAIGGVNLNDEPTDVADILIDLVQRETRTFSNRFARLLMGEMKNTAKMHKHPLKSAGFRVLKAPDVPSVLVELGYVSNKADMENLVSEGWRTRIVGSMAKAVDIFLAKKLATVGASN